MTPHIGHPRPLDLIISVIDNYGDIGMVCEFIQAMERAFPHEFTFFIWTDDVVRVREFFSVQTFQDVFYCIAHISEFGMECPSRVACLFFHAPIPDGSCFASRAYVLRIDYISFELDWIEFHGKEHLISTPDRYIEEYIPSCLPGGGGMIPVNTTFYTREALIQRFGLPGAIQASRWIPCFLYPDAYEYIDWSTIPEDITVLLFDASDVPSPRCISLPFMDRYDFYSFFHHADWAMIRGEVSFVQILQMNIPFLWDMYKFLGGFSREQSIQFLDTFSHDQVYREFHNILNGQIDGKISFQNIDLFFSQYKKTGKFELPPTKNMILEVKKKIDRFEFSI